MGKALVLLSLLDSHLVTSRSKLPRVDVPSSMSSRMFWGCLMVLRRGLNVLRKVSTSRTTSGCLVSAAMCSIACPLCFCHALVPGFDCLKVMLHGYYHLYVTLVLQS